MIMRVLGAVAVAVVAVIAYQGDRGPVPAPPMERPAAVSPDPSPTTPEARLAEIRRITGGACTPGRNSTSDLAGIGFYCLPFDSIPAVDHPTFVPVAEADIPEVEPVVAIETDGPARAYPIRFLITHEVVNDRVGREPIVVSFCPLCNSATAFSRRVGDRTLIFGVSGQLLSANLVMFDRETISLWQQVTGRAFSGDYRGTTLERLPVQMVAFGSWREAHPDGVVMEEPTPGFDYGDDPYASYGGDPTEESRFFRPPPESGIDVRTDPRLPPKWRIVGVQKRRNAVAFPVPEGRGAVAVATARLKGAPLVAFFSRGVAEPSTASRLQDGNRGWAGVVYRATLKGRELSFRHRQRHRDFVETSTGSTFDLFGKATSGPLAGSRLRSVDQITAFWFSWSDSYPRTKVARPL